MDSNITSTQNKSIVKNLPEHFIKITGIGAVIIYAILTIDIIHDEISLTKRAIDYGEISINILSFLIISPFVGCLAGFFGYLVGIIMRDIIEISYLYRSSQNKAIIEKLPKICQIIIGVVTVTIYTILRIKLIQNSTSSTAAINYFYLPIENLGVFVLSGFLGYLVGIIIRGIIERSYLRSVIFFFAFIITLPTILYCSWIGIKLSFTHIQVNNIKNMDREELDKAFIDLQAGSSYPTYDIYVLAAIALNPKASSKVLDKIAHLDHPNLNDRLFSLTGLIKENRKGLATIRLVAHNPNVSIETLKYMMNSNDYDLLGDIAQNELLSAEDLRQLFIMKTQNNTSIDRAFINNHNTPEDILRAIANRMNINDRDFNYKKHFLNSHPNKPKDISSKL